ncbi:dienelactone hydrolase-like protein [Aureococcus anophagefferens]|nr:dienelactone hydrolase-like protein [Aureococcus anophagefferens]
MGPAKTRELFSLRELDLTSLAQGFAAQLAAHFLLALALFSVGVGARGVDWVSSTSSHLASAARAHVDGLLVSWETMLPEWWRGWLFGLLTAALLMDVVAVAETRFFGDAPGSASAIAKAAGRGAGTAADPRRARDDAWAAAARQVARGPAAQEPPGGANCRRPKNAATGVRVGRRRDTARRGLRVAGSRGAQGRAAGRRVVPRRGAERPVLILEGGGSGAACCVLVADLFGDANGDGWDGVWAAARAGCGTRGAARSRRRRGDGARALEPVDGSKCACLGWCLGGRAAAALAAASPEGLKAAVSFHGVFSGVVEAARAEDAPSCALLILSGSDDPSSDLDGAVAALAAAGVPYETRARRRGAAANPAQALRDNAAFAYDDKAATGAGPSRRGASRRWDTMIFAYHVCNVSEKTAPPWSRPGQKTRPSVSGGARGGGLGRARGVGGGADRPGRREYDALDRGEHGALDRRGGSAPRPRRRESRRRGGSARGARCPARKRKNANGVDRVKRYHGLPLLYDGESKLFSASASAPSCRQAGPARRFERGGFHALGGGEFVGARAVQPLNKYGRVDDELSGGSSSSAASSASASRSRRRGSTRASASTTT